MEKQRNRPQMKEQENSPEEGLNEMGQAIYDIEFKVMIIRMLNSMKSDTETIRKDQPKMKTTISEINNTLEGISSRLDETDDQISNLEDKVEKINT